MSLKKAQKLIKDFTVPRADQNAQVVRQHVLWAMGVGLLPLPVLDLAAVTTVQLHLIRSLAEIYNQKDFDNNIGKSTLAALSGSSFARVGSSLAKGIPAVGSVLGGISMSATSGAATFAVAQVCIAHFEAGGTMESFRTDDWKQAYEDFFQQGKDYVQQLSAKSPSVKPGFANPEDDVFVKLEKLAQLKEKGILSEEEFQAKKTQLLKRV